MIRGAVILVVALAAACSKSDASDPGPHSPSDETAPTDAPAEAEPPDLSQHSFPLLVWAAWEVERDYFDKSRFDPRAQLLSAVTSIGLDTPEFFAEVEGDTLRVRVRAAQATFSLDGLATVGDAAVGLEEVLQFAQKVLDLPAEPLHELEYVAINGLLAPLDPHTILLTPEEHADLGVKTKGEFGGVGAAIRAERRRILVVSVLPDMPAERAGVAAGDFILTIDGESTVNMTEVEAQQRLRGPLGSEVKVKLQRGKKTLTVTITRETIRIESVRKALLPDAIAYLGISAFQENTAEQLGAAIGALGGTDLRGLVLDLRGNSGGVLTQATEVVDVLVSAGDLVIVRSAMGEERAPATDGEVLPQGAAVVVLVDEESASAAEIVAGGLQSLGRAVVLGRGSFGKGTVQMIRPNAPYGRELALKLTLAEYLVAGPRRIQSVGVLPDLELAPVQPSGIPGIVRYYDRERFERERERSKVAHLPSAKHDDVPDEAPRSPLGLAYLWSDAVPDKLAKDPQGKPLVVPDELRDPEIRIGFEVARALVGTEDPQSRTRVLGETAARLGVEEDARIVDALAGDRIDWSPPAAGAGAPALVARAELVQPGPIVAGQPFSLRLVVENTSSNTAHRVHAITDCVHDELDGIELVMGAIAPGASATREIKLHVMPWHGDFTDALGIDVHVGDPDEEPDARAKVMFDIAGSARPSLAYDWWIVDDPELAKRAPARPAAETIVDEPPFAVSGNGDGVLQPGEKVLLAFTAYNDGPGDSPDVRALVRNLSGRQGLLEEGFVELGAIAAGSSKSGAFGISVADDADPALPLEVELVVGDSQLRTSAQDKLRLRVLAATNAIARAPRTMVAGDDGVRLYAGAHASATVVAELPAAAAIAVVGTVGGFAVVEHELGGRRLFVPDDLLAPAKGKVAPAPIDRRRAAQPPAIALDPVPRSTTVDRVRLSGTATHPTRVRDVVVLVRPPGASQLDKKVDYTASEADAGDDDAKQLRFEADVPLAPGGNRITVLARDGGKVVHRRDVWVYRE